MGGEPDFETVPHGPSSAPQGPHLRDRRRDEMVAMRIKGDQLTRHYHNQTRKIDMKTSPILLKPRRKLLFFSITARSRAHTRSSDGVLVPRIFYIIFFGCDCGSYTSLLSRNDPPRHSYEPATPTRGVGDSYRVTAPGPHPHIIL